MRFRTLVALSAASAFVAGAVGYTILPAQSDEVRKFNASELHYVGSSCQGPYFAMRGSDLVMSDGTAERVLSSNVTVDDLGLHRVSVSSAYNWGSIVMEFSLKSDGSVATVDDVHTVPDLTREQSASPAGTKMRAAAQLFKSNSYILCPVSKS